MGGKFSMRDKQEFMQAVARNDQKYVAEKLTFGFPIDAKDTLGQTGCHWAAYRGNLEVLQYLASRKADINAKDNDGRTPLHWAIRKEHLDVLKFLLKAGSPVDEQTRGMNDSALHIASREGSLDGVRLLLSYNANVDLMNKKGSTAAEIAREMHDVEIEERLEEGEAGDDEGGPVEPVQETSSVEGEEQKSAPEAGGEEPTPTESNVPPESGTPEDPRGAAATVDENTVFKEIYELLESRPKPGDPCLKTEYDQVDESNKKRETSDNIEEIDEERVLSGGKGRGCIIS